MKTLQDCLSKKPLNWERSFNFDDCELVAAYHFWSLDIFQACNFVFSPGFRATIFRAFVMQLLNIGMNFENAFQRVKSMKNATVSPCKTDKPSSFDVVNLAKWKAWSSLLILNSDEAKRKYTEFVETLMGEPLSNDANLPDNNVVYENSTSQEETTPEKEEYSSSRKVLLEDKGKIFRILLNRSEKKNALTHEMYRDIIDGLKATEKSEAFITEKGEYFCSGYYLNNLLVKPTDRAKMAADAKLLLRDFVGTFIDYPEVLIATVNDGGAMLTFLNYLTADKCIARDNCWGLNLLSSVWALVRSINVTCRYLIDMYKERSSA
ncbi:Enoyl-CoA delta isomerase 2, mitochondrial [Trichinella zimbabwensis]|uniref:Enoyl-CoA delta isomerase 2, mitochondrial n=1 Tax=Trichinella zimbabwensis TaxID=268475 RepID=A0A0V1HD37_9BILA|nr:Enoyl-CoA delta isomerase 2, mitochondrial [Trichinella zimbabwensis]